MHRLRIVGGMDRDGGEACVARRTRDADRDLAAVSDQQFMEGHERFRSERNDAAIGSPRPACFPYPNQQRDAARRQFLVTEHETFAEILCKWNFVPQHGIHTAG
jgi:hypothetical protein